MGAVPESGVLRQPLGFCGGQVQVEQTVQGRPQPKIDAVAALVEIAAEKQGLDDPGPADFAR